ncbi:MAG: hypothetical protein K9H48_16395 [Melioribacteraceae bacterium]|nr:hypothetical protein [Melioribacteraceae bacterium]MCF8394404.1 hypothetical protein [Melioribacteraceae bacterium]MCF8417500.1 hypothetical protein [Melioribacteraceae bacterium]
MNEWLLEHKLLIELIVAVSTVLTLIVIYFTLVEMKKQRLKIYEPFILPVNSTFNVIKEISDLKWIVNSSDSPELFLQLRNIGQGVAKDIVIELYYPIKFQEYFKILANEFKENDISMNFDISDKSCCIEEKKDNKIIKRSNFPFESKQKYYFDYSIPIRDDDTSINLNLPTSIKEMFSLTIILYHYNLNIRPFEIFERLINYINIEIRINYKDNLSRKYKDSFKMVLDKPGVSFSSEEGNNFKLSLDRENKYFA